MWCESGNRTAFCHLFWGVVNQKFTSAVDRMDAVRLLCSAVRCGEMQRILCASCYASVWTSTQVANSVRMPPENSFFQHLRRYTLWILRHCSTYSHSNYVTDSKEVRLHVHDTPIFSDIFLFYVFARIFTYMLSHKFAHFCETLFSHYVNGHLCTFDT